MDQDQYDAFLDARGLSCPIPLLKARQALMVLEPGATVCVIATDPASIRDFEDFSDATGNELLEAAEQDGIFKLVVRKS